MPATKSWGIDLIVVLPNSRKRMTLLAFRGRGRTRRLAVSVSAQERPEIRFGNPQHAVHSVRAENLVFDPAPKRLKN